MSIESKYPVTVRLSGTDGNAGALMGKVTDALRQYWRETEPPPGGAAQELAEFRRQCMSGDYDNLLQTCMKWVEVE